LTIVSQAPTVNTSTTVASSANPSFIDQLVNLTATVTAATGTTAPVGAVQFYIDGKPDELVPLTAGTGASATATLVGHKFEQVGTFQVKAEYIPDPTSTFFESLGQLVPDQQVTLITTTTTVGASPNPSTSGDSVTFTATVTPAAGSPLPFDNGGTVQFQVGGQNVGTPQPLSGGMASYTDTTLGVGANQTVTAIYSGDNDFSGSQGNVVGGVTVNGQTINTTTTVGSSKNPSTSGDSVTFTATVTPASGTFDNGGTVQFKIDGSNYGSPQPLSGGMASISDSALSVANHSVEADYSGDTAFGGSTGTLSGGQTVNAAATAPVLTLPSPQTVSEGAAIPINMGSFTDSSAGPWTMDMSWGDGSPDNTFNVSSTGALPSIYHLYAEENTYSVTLKLTNTTDNLFASQTFQVIVSDPSINAVGGFSTQSAEGSSTGQQLVASFSDPAGPESSGNYSSSINWGDGSSATAGTISSLIGSVNVNIYSGHTTTGSGTPFTGLVNSFTAQSIQFGASTGYNWHPLNASTQQPMSDFGADITGTIRAPAAGTYSFTLGSDDGSQLYIDGNLVIDNGGERNFTDTTHTVTLTAGTHSLEVQFFENGTGASGVDLNSYVVTGSHTYAEESASSGYNIATTINHDQSTAVTVNSTATLSDPAVTPTNTTIAVVQDAQFSGTVATFTDPAGSEPNASDPGPVSSHYSATINWGDGSGTSAGVISGPDGNGVYTVTATHQFTQATTTTSTISLSSASALAAAIGPGVPSATAQNELDAGNTTGLTFGADLVGAYGSTVAVPPGAPGGTPVINIAPGDGESGFFETTFFLPSNVSGVQLAGAANVDDVGRVFLNGNAISPSIFSSDPARITLSGNAMFSTSNESFFNAGLNTLLIADSNIGGGPSGAAFWAKVTYGAGTPLPVMVTIHHESAPDATTTSPVTVNPTTLTWDGVPSGNWTDPQWTGAGGTYPNGGISAIVDTSSVVQVNSPQAANALAISSGGQVAVGAGGNLAVTTDTNVTAAGTLSVDPNGTFSTGGTLLVDSGGTVSGGTVSANAYQLNDGTVSASLTGPGGLTKDTAGTVTISGANSYAGPTTIDAGTLVVEPGALPIGTSLVIGGTASAPATVIVAASNANGNPLGAASGSAQTGQQSATSRSAAFASGMADQASAKGATTSAAAETSAAISPALGSPLNQGGTSTAAALSPKNSPSAPSALSLNRRTLTSTFSYATSRVAATPIEDTAPSAGSFDALIAGEINSPAQRRPGIMAWTMPGLSRSAAPTLHLGGTGRVMISPDAADELFSKIGI
jgi:autotransporter-associated beta strand protein